MLDRFSSPLTGEGLAPSLDEIAFQNERNKESIVRDFVWNYLNEYHMKPDPEDVQDILYRLDVDLATIEDIIKEETEFLRY
jgi:hypothetical protein